MCTIARRLCSQVGVVSLGLARCEGPCGLGTELRYLRHSTFFFIGRPGPGVELKAQGPLGEISP